MPLYIEQSGDLDRCYRCLTDRLTTLKNRATQLLIKYKSGALVTQNVQDIIICYGRQNEIWPISAIIFTSS